MPQFAHDTTESVTRPGAAGEDGPVGLTFFLAALEPVIVETPVFHHFDGAVARDDAEAIWLWIARDAAPEAAADFAMACEGGEAPGTALDRVAPDLIEAIGAARDKARHSEKTDNRLTVQMGGEMVRARLPFILVALRSRPVIAKARDFGKAANTTADEAGIGTALKAMPLSESALIAMMMHAAVGQVANPSRFVLAAIKQAGGGTDAAISRAGFGPLIEAMLSHAQEQVAIVLASTTMHGDPDLACRAIERFHRLIRAVTGYIEMSRENIWQHVASDLTRRMSERLETRLREVTAEVNIALRRPREGPDSIDAEDVLSALGGLYILRSVRSCRSSLALNVVFERVWGETGHALEMLLSRALETFRDDPADPVRRERLEAGIKMAEIRFDSEYADIMRRARDGASRLTG